MLKFCVFLLAALCAFAYEKEENVLVLTDANIDEAIKEFEFLLVEFYAPWCGHCKSLAPEYAKAATTLAEQGSSIMLAKVDATENSESAGKYGVRGYPTLKFFVNGEDSEYSGGRTADTIVSWLKKKTGPPCKPLASQADVESFKDGADVVVVAFLSTDSDDFKTVESAARLIEDVEFAVVSDAAVASALGASFPSLVLYKKFDEGKNVFDGAFSSDEVKAFVSANSVALVSTFTQATAPKIFGSGVDNHFLYFNAEGAEGHKDVMTALAEVAADFKGKTLFVFVPSTESRVMSYFDFSEADLPKAVLVSLGEGDMKKYAFDKDINAANVRAHVQAYHAGELKRTLKSEEVPADNNGPVTVIVGKNFEEIVMDDSKDVLLEFYAPWCGHCKSLAPTYDKLGEKYANDANIVIAKVDATANDIEHPQVSVRGFPTIMFFPAGDKQNPVTYEGGRDFDDFVEYIEKHSTVPRGGAAAAAESKEKTEL